jgi:deoxyribodipyrimidine photo-lyase
MVDTQRISLLNQGRTNNNGPVVYWMSRDQRVLDNWALLYAIGQGNALNVPVDVVFTLSNSFLGANLRHYTFMIDGLKQVEKNLKSLGITFKILTGNPEEVIPTYLNEISGSLLISDFDPLRIKRQWKDNINVNLSIPHHEVDAHNIVPCRVASQKVEFGAYTLRPKINRLLAQFLTEFPETPKVRNNRSAQSSVNWQEVLEWLNPDASVKPVSWIKPGEDEAHHALNHFIATGLNGYNIQRNNPLANGQSNLSPYLHYGQLSAQRVAIEVSKANAPNEDKSAFLEELIVRRELSENFCHYNPNYDSFDGFHAWAKESHQTHRRDEREYQYKLDEFELSKTHDDLWNAAQNEVVKTGKMHGYMRMYWAKKILEWTKSPEQAMEFAIYLNDKYILDGRDPNGYAGIAWSIGGVHDRAWGTRPVFGKIRYMNYNGCKRKFDVEGYIYQVSIK